MTLEFENPPFLSNIGLNSSFNNEADFTPLDRVTSKAKKTSVISVARKESLLAKGKIGDNREMSGTYSDDYDSYDDDFDSPSPSKEPNRRYSRSSRRSRSRDRDRSPSSSPPKNRSHSKKASSRRDSFASYRSAYGTNRGPTKPKSKKSHSAASKVTTKTTGGESSMMRRVLSANRHKVSRLNNIVEELYLEVDELKSENKSLKRVSHRQEKEIKKIDDEEASLPILLQRHSAEMRTLKERLRRNQEVLHKKEMESHDRDKEIQKLHDKVKNYRELSEDKKLEERAALAKKLENVTNEMASKDKKILDLEKAISLKDKMRQREMKEQKERYKQAKEELKRVQEDFRSLRERLQEKERELDEKNIYHQHITQQKKKSTTLPALALPALASHVPTLTAPVIHADKPAEAKEKRTNVFLTNAPSDSGSVTTDEGKDSVQVSLKSDVRSEKPAASGGIKPALFEVDGRPKDEDERLRREAEDRRRRLEEDERRRVAEDGRRRLEEDERRRVAEDGRRRLEEDERRRHAEEEDRKRREEEERRRKEEDERRKREEEELKKQREEQDRGRKQREEEEKTRLEEEAEIRRKKDLLLARMRAIDAGNDKPSAVIPTGTAVEPAVENKPKKLPIFLQSHKPLKTEPQQVKPTVNSISEDDIFSDTSSGRKRQGTSSKQSGYSYDFKQTVENLHHGLPAHASLESVKNEGAKVDSSDDLNFGAYKPTLGRRAGAKRDKETEELAFGSYNPSFGAKKDTTRRNSGLDFAAGKKVTSEKEQNGVIFGDYKPSLAPASKKPSSTQPNGDIFGERNSPVRSRRPRNFPGKGAAVFGDDLLTNEDTKPAGVPLFGDKSFAKDKSSYPWENKVNVSRRPSDTKEQDDSLLPRRKHLQSIGKSAEKNVRAVDNALDDFDDDIEEVIL